MIYPLRTYNYQDYYDKFTSNEFLKEIITSEWSTSTYEGIPNSPNRASFNLLDGFTLKSNKLSWFTYPETDKWRSAIDELRMSMASSNHLNIDICKMGTAFLILVPGAHLQEHIDNGEYGGTSLIIPVLGEGVFTYNNNEKKYLINSPTYVDNTVWHNFINTSNKLVIIMTVAMPITISDLKETGLEVLNELS